MAAGSSRARGFRDDCRPAHRFDDERFRHSASAGRADPLPRECARRHSDRSSHEDVCVHAPSRKPPCASYAPPSSCRSPPSERYDRLHRSLTSPVWSDRVRRHLGSDTRGTEGDDSKNERHADTPGIDGTALDKSNERLSQGSVHVSATGRWNMVRSEGIDWMNSRVMSAQIQATSLPTRSRRLSEAETRKAEFRSDPWPTGICPRPKSKSLAGSACLEPWFVACTSVRRTRRGCRRRTRTLGGAGGRTGLPGHAGTYLKRAVALSLDPLERAKRAVAAAEGSIRAGALDDAVELLAVQKPDL